MITTFSGVGGWVGGWCGRMENKAISAFNFVEVEVEAELSLAKISFIGTSVTKLGRPNPKGRPQ